jgi:hypothetical protein
MVMEGRIIVEGGMVVEGRGCDVYTVWLVSADQG